MKSVLNKNLKIEIRPIPNRNKIREFSKELENFSERHTLIPYVNYQRKYMTGLNNDDIVYLKSLGVKFDLSDDYITDTPHPLWDSQQIKVDLTSSPTFLYPYKNPLDYIKWKFILVSDYVYASEKEMQEGGKPLATHYIYNEEVEAEVKSKGIVERNKLFSIFDGLSDTQKRNLLLMVFDESFENKTTETLIERFEEALKYKIDKVKMYIEDDTESLVNKACIRKAIRLNIIKKASKGYYYFDVQLGVSEEDVYKNLTSEENSEILLQIKSKIS